MIIGLTGFAQSGKDTVAKILIEKYDFQRVAFADPIRELLYEMNPKITLGYDIHSTLQLLVDQEGWDTAKQNPEVRSMLQNLGVGARKVFSENFWVQQAMRRVHFEENWVITDVRFENEAKAIKKYDNSQIWRIKRNGVGPINGHVSERELDGYPVDQIFMNSGSIEDLELLIKTRMMAHV